jgi:S1-C subfamily serine protease
MKFLLVPVLLLGLLTAANADIIDDLQDASVTIRTPKGQGSAVLFTRQVGNDTVTFVWTAGHVIENLRKTRRVIDPKEGSTKTLIEFEDAEVVQEFRQDGRRIGELVLDAKVIRYSDAQQGEDLALLQIRKKNFVGPNVTVHFYLESETPKIGTELFHVGSLKGQFGANSLTTGVISQIGRVLKLGANGVVFDQTTVTAFPGSSGGGVFLKNDGRYVGMLVRGSGEQFNFIVPIRRIRDWAVRCNLEWAIDPACDVPSEDELRRLPVEDAGMPEFMPQLQSPTPAGFDFLFDQNPDYVEPPA